MKNIDLAVTKMNLITMYEQGYLSLSEFTDEFPDSISESQECLFGSKCVGFYVAVTLGKTECCYYIQAYGGDQYENDERLCIEDKNIEDEQAPFGAVHFE
ncbi:hypothetical protein [Enterococcus casseliflavus]|uniref:hypothetical protein n=2 Tax=Enterococcus casseliflavus TaxID=37734 RepID=UPI0018CCC3E9|nr:hypothetical protein [Enterococcus casseliflavus]